MKKLLSRLQSITWHESCIVLSGVVPSTYFKLPNAGHTYTIEYSFYNSFWLILILLVAYILQLLSHQRGTAHYIKEKGECTISTIKPSSETIQQIRKDYQIGEMETYILDRLYPANSSQSLWSFVKYRRSLLTDDKEWELFIYCLFKLSDENRIKIYFLTEKEWRIELA